MDEEDNIMSTKDLKEYFIKKGSLELAKEIKGGESFNTIKSKHGISGKVTFRICKEYKNSVIGWINPKDSNYEELIMIRMSRYTFNKIKKSKSLQVPYDLLSDYFDHSAKTSRGVQYFELHVTTHNEADPYDEPVDPDPTGSLQNDARRELYGNYDSGDWGGLTGEEAELGRWNCD